MKTLVTILGTVCVTVGFITGVLFNMGIITIERVEEAHNKQVIVDGEIVNDVTWSETLGFDINVDVVDGTYIGK